MIFHVNIQALESECFIWIPQVKDHFISLNVKKFNPLSVNPTKWSNTLKQFIGWCRQICLSVFDHFVGLALKGLRRKINNNGF